MPERTAERDHTGPLEERPSRADASEVLEALDALAARNRERPDPSAQLRLRDLRARAAAIKAGGGDGDDGGGGGDRAWPPEYRDPFPGAHGHVPEIDLGRLDAETVGGAVAHHGALIVRGVFDQHLVGALVTAIERIHVRRGSSAVPAVSEDPSGVCGFRPRRFGPPPLDSVLRKLQHDQGGAWLADSPAATELVLDGLARAGVTAMIHDHFGERPCISLQKSTLRRTTPDYHLVSWHQDGAFLGDDVRTLNVWVALSACGGDLPTPGLEVVPSSLPVLPPEGRLVPYSVSSAQVQAIAAVTPTVVPRFEPGDAIVFDERFLHRTHRLPRMTTIRYALECWFFAPSHTAEEYTPLLT